MKKNLSKLPDELLQKLISERNESAFEVIYNRYWKRLFLYAYKIYREEEVCEDIIQEIFISFWNNSSDTVILNLEGYFFRAVKYKIANHIRNLKFTKDHIDVLNNMPAYLESINDIEYKEFENNMMLHIEQLSPKCREVFTLSRLEHLSNSEIAKKLGLSIHTVEKHISNALKELRSNVNIWQYNIVLLFMFL